MTKKNKFIWKLIQVVCWVIFLGFCIQAGALLFNYLYSFFQPLVTHNIYPGLDLSELFNKSKLLYSVVILLITATSAFKGYIFFKTITLFRVLNLVKPFSKKVSAILTKISYYTFSLGIVCLAAQNLWGSYLQTVSMQGRRTDSGMRAELM